MQNDSRRTLAVSITPALLTILTTISSPAVYADEAANLKPPPDIGADASGADAEEASNAAAEVENAEPAASAEMGGQTPPTAAEQNTPSKPATPKPTATTPVDPVLRLALLNVSAEGIEERIVSVVTNSILTELRKLRKVTVIGLDEVQAILDFEEQKQMMGCDDTSCLADLAGALGVDNIIVGSLAQVSDKTVMALKRIDQEEAEVITTYQKYLVPQGGEEFLAAIGPGIETLFPDRPLRDGQTRGVPEEVALRLSPPPLPPWVVYTGAGVAGVTALSAVALGSYSLIEYIFFQLAAADGQQKPVDFGALNAQTWRINIAGGAAWGLVAVTLGVAAATGVLALFTDWQGYGDE